MDRLTSLLAFGRVVECGGFSAAARRLNMSVTMVSAHVQALEERLGARLLHRTTRKVSLTEIGQAYYARSSQILLELEEADNIAAALHSTPRGVLKIYASIHIVRFLTPVVAEFLRTYPAVTLDLTIGEHMVDMLEEGYDLAVRTVPLPDSSLVVRRLTPWRHVLCCAPCYLDRRPAPSSPAELVHHNCLRYAYYPFGNEWRFEGPGGEIVSVPISGNVVTNSADTLRLLALGGDGLFLAPSFVVAGDLAEGALLPLVLDHRPVEFTIHAIYPHRRLLSAKLHQFIDLLVLRFAEHRYWMTGESQDDRTKPSGAG